MRIGCTLSFTAFHLGVCYGLLSPQRHSQHPPCRPSTEPPNAPTHCWSRCRPRRESSPGSGFSFLRAESRLKKCSPHAQEPPIDETGRVQPFLHFAIPKSHVRLAFGSSVYYITCQINRTSESSKSYHTCHGIHKIQFDISLDHSIDQPLSTLRHPSFHQPPINCCPNSACL